MSASKRAKQSSGLDLARTIGTSIGRLDGSLDRLEGQETILRSFSVKGPSESQGDYFLVSRWWVGGQAKVSFHSASTLWECLKGFADRIQNGSIKFHDDQYA